MKKILALIIAIFINLLYLNWIIIVQDQKLEKLSAEQVKPAAAKIISIPQSTNSCSESCLSAIKQATSGATITKIQTRTVSTGVSAFFVPFGSGSSSSTDWQDVSGLQAYVDTANYGTIKTVTFEASVHIPTGNETANVRLFNVTDSHPVWYSEVFYGGGSNSQLLISQPISLDKGNKLYQVQMKTQLTFPAILDQARLHILTN